jgi:hypothetical protein
MHICYCEGVGICNDLGTDILVPSITNCRRVLVQY